MSDYKPIEKLDYTFYKWIHTSKDLTDLCYVGSTANITNRKYQHKSNSNNPNNKSYNNLLYATIRENGGFENFKMVILGTAEQITKREAQALEEQYRLAEQASLNGRRCYTTDEQKLELKKQHYKEHKEQYKQYRQNNKETITEYNKQYHQDNAEILKIQRRIKYLENKKNNK